MNIDQQKLLDNKDFLNIIEDLELRINFKGDLKIYLNNSLAPSFIISEVLEIMSKTLPEYTKGKLYEFLLNHLLDIQNTLEIPSKFFKNNKEFILNKAISNLEIKQKEISVENLRKEIKELFNLDIPYSSKMWGIYLSNLGYTKKRVFRIWTKVSNLII